MTRREYVHVGSHAASMLHMVTENISLIMHSE